MSVPPNFSFVRPGVAGGGLPTGAEQIAQLAKEHNIGLLVTVLPAQLPAEYFAGTGVANVFVQAADQTVTDEDALVKAIAKAQEVEKEGKAVLFHCKMGMGRTSTALSAYIAVADKLSVADATALVASKRPAPTSQKDFVERVVAKADSTN